MEESQRLENNLFEVKNIWKGILEERSYYFNPETFPILADAAHYLKDVVGMADTIRKYKTEAVRGIAYGPADTLASDKSDNIVYTTRKYKVEDARENETIEAMIVGYGHAGKMHANIFSGSGEVNIIGVVDPSEVKQQQIQEAGFPAFENIDAALSVVKKRDASSLFWDICVPDENHFEVMEQLLRNGANKILVEKPICVPTQVNQMRDLLRTYPGVKVCVEETYLASSVLLKVNEMASKYGLVHPKIYVEQTKNRMKDIEEGRFIDRELMIFGLEAPHSVTLIAGTGRGRRPATIRNVELKDMTLPNGRILQGQGLGRIDFLTEDNCEATLYTSMEGEIGRPLAEIQAPNGIPYKDDRRYRILVLEEKDVMSIGQFEPIPEWERFKGRVLVFKKGQKLEEIVVEDRPMERMLMWAVEFFRGERDNPSPPETALSFVEFLGEAIKFHLK